VKKFIKIAGFYMFKYLLGFLLVFSTSVLMFTVAQNSIECYILGEKQSQIQEGVHQTEEAVEKIELISKLVYQSQGFSKLLYQKDPYPSETILQIRESNDLIMKIGNLANYTPYMFVLFKKNDFFLSNCQSSFDLNKYYGEFFSVNFPDKTFEDGTALKNYLFENYKSGNDFLQLNEINYRNNGNQTQLDGALIYLTDGTTEYKSYFHIFCFVLSKEYLVENILTSELKEEGFLYIQDMFTGEELLSYGEISEETKAIAGEGTAETAGYHTTVIDNKKLGWHVVAGIPSTLVDEHMKSAQRLLMVYLWIGLAAVLVLTLYFSLARYYGFRKVLHVIPEMEVPSEGRKRLNDYDFLLHNVAKLDEKKETYRIQADEQRRQNQALLLENLITRGEGTEQERRIFEEYFGKEPEFYCIAMVRFQHIESVETINAATVVMGDFLRQREVSLLGNVHSGISDELFLIELHGSQEGNTDALCKIFEEMTEVVSKAYGCILHVGISTVGTELSNISKCYDRSKRIVQSMYAQESENKVLTYKMDTNQVQENAITAEFLNRLYTMLICGKYEDIEKTLYQIEGHYKRMPFLYEAHRERFFYSLENIFYAALLQLNCKNGEAHLPVYDVSLPCDEMIKTFLNSAAWICEYISQGKKSNNEKLKEQILAILLTNYADPNLSAYTVSQEVNIAENYLYHFWKDQTGETFATYLLWIRIDKAKEYLVTTDYSNKEIASLTGFSSDNTFYRNFQKLTGVSPKIYKEQKQNNVKFS